MVRNLQTGLVEGERRRLLSVVVPAFNEAGRIVRTLEATLRFFDERGDKIAVLVVDDGSTDDTSEVVARWAKERGAEDRVKALRYERNRGKGGAVRYGVLRAEGDHVLFMDADLATPIEEIVKLEAAIQEGGADYAIGSRPLRESQLLVRQPWYREMLGRTFNGAVQAIATPGIHDTQCGFKLLTRDAARAIFARTRLDGFSFDVEALFLARRLGFSIAEVPVRWAHQEGAAAFASKGAYLRHGLKMLADLFQIRWMHRGVQPVVTASSAPSISA